MTEFAFLFVEAGRIREAKPRSQQDRQTLVVRTEPVVDGLDLFGWLAGEY